VIVTAIWTLITAPVNAILTLLGSLPSPPDFAGMVNGFQVPGGQPVPGLHGLFQLLAWANWYAPVSDMLAVFSIGLTVIGVVYGFKATLWVLAKLHITGGGDE